MLFSPNNFYHVYNQGNNRQRIFHTVKEYRIFLTLCKRQLLPHCSILAWCLMPNHFHFLIHTDERCLHTRKQGSIELGAINNGFRLLLSGYARITNNMNDRSGSLFRQKTKGKLICSNSHGDPDRPYLANCFEYIHQNPARSGLVNEPAEWNFSSCKCYIEHSEDGITDRMLAMQFDILRPGSFGAKKGSMLPAAVLSKIT